MNDTDIVVVRTPTLIDFIDVVKYAFNTGHTWYNSRTDLRTHLWTHFREETCLRISKSLIDFCEFNYYYKYCNFKIVTADDFLCENRISERLKDFI